MKGTVNVALTPFHDVAQLGPIHDLLERKLLNRRTRDDHAVEEIALDAVEIFIEREHMLDRSIFGSSSAHREKLDLDLKRRVAQKTRQLSFSGDLRGH